MPYFDNKWVPRCFGNADIDDSDCADCDAYDDCVDAEAEGVKPELMKVPREPAETDAVKQLGRDVAAKCAHTAAVEVAKFLEKLCK